MKKLLVIILCFGLTACFSGVSAPSRFYTLTPVMERSVSDKTAASIGIDRVQVARYLDRPQIITQAAETSEVNLSETDRWIEPLPNLVQRIVTEDLAAALPNALVKMKTQGREEFTYTLAVDIVKMDAVLGGQATLEAWYLIQNNVGKIIARHKVNEVAAVGSSFDDVARVQSELLGRLATQIATTVARLK